jgi:hypothetical protein
MHALTGLFRVIWFSLSKGYIKWNQFREWDVCTREIGTILWHSFLSNNRHRNKKWSHVLQILNEGFFPWRCCYVWDLPLCRNNCHLCRIPTYLDIELDAYFTLTGSQWNAVSTRWRPPHFHHEVKSFLDRHFPGKLIGRGGANIWPPRSSDLTSLGSLL